jgi:DNA-binding NarL/FixJ family response regulator
MANKAAKLRVLIADDDPGVCSAIQLLLQENTNSRVVGIADSAAKVIDRTKSEALDLVLLDWELPGCRGADLVREIRWLSPGVSVIVLHSRPLMRRPALAAGADDFVSKGDPPERLLAALQKLQIKKNKGDSGDN